MKIAIHGGEIQSITHSALSPGLWHLFFIYGNQSTDGFRELLESDKMPPNDGSLVSHYEKSKELPGFMESNMKIIAKKFFFIINWLSLLFISKTELKWEQSIFAGGEKTKFFFVFCFVLFFKNEQLGLTLGPGLSPWYIPSVLQNGSDLGRLWRLFALVHIPYCLCILYLLPTNLLIPHTSEPLPGYSQGKDVYLLCCQRTLSRVMWLCYLMAGVLVSFLG